MERMFKRFLSLALVVFMIVSMMPVNAFAADGTEGAETSNNEVAAVATGNVAKVGNTEYATIDEAIANWTNGSTLTLLANVTLTKVIELSSTEHHILDLGTYTMTAASNKDAIQIVNNGRTSASYALDIKADATNPGGITASGKAVVKTTGKSGVKDRPIIRFYNGVFNASNIVSHSGSNGTNCPQFQFHGGVFNGSISTNRTLNQFYGGTFNGKFYMSVDSSAYALIAGGRFKYLDNLYGSALNTDKFTIGSGKGVFDKGVYVDKEGYFVVGGPVITELSEKYPAVASNVSKAGSYLPYSSAATYGLFYEDADMAIAKHGAANVTIWEKPAVTIPENVTGDAMVVEEIKNNTALNGYTPENLPTGAELEIELKSVGETIVYDVTPMANGTEVEPTEAITFRLPVPASVNKTLAKVYHDGELMGIYEITGEGNAKYVEVSSADFSKFAVEPIEHYEVDTYEELIAALANDGAYVIMTADITATATQSSGYGKAGIVIDAGDVLDGNGKTLTINGAGATWDCAIAMRGGEVKNLTIAGAMRGVFMPGANGDVVIDNCKFKNVIYTFNSDAGSKDYTVTIKNTTLNGWTSFSNVHKSVTFEKCTFGEGSGYAYCRPYQATTFVDCDFAEGYEFDTKQTASETLVFTDCTYNGEALSAENNAMFYNGGNVMINGVDTDVTNYPVKIGTKGYATLAAAIAAAEAGDTITFYADITEDVTVSKDLTIDGAGKTFTGNMKLTSDKGTATIKNVNFDGNGYNGYAVDARGVYYITIEDCTAKNYGFGFLQLASSTVKTTVKNVTISNMNYGVKVDYSGAVELENVDITAGVAAVLNSNYGEKTITIKNSELNIYGTWSRNNTVKTNVVFEGENTVGEFKIDATIDNFKLAADATLIAPKGLTVTTDAEESSVVYKNGKYQVVGNVAKIDETGYAYLEEAFEAAAEDDTIVLLTDATPVLTSQRAITKAAVIDLNGKTLTLTEDDLYFGTTTFKNGKIVVASNVNASTAVFWMFENQTLTFNEVKIDATGVTGTYLIGINGGSKTAVNLIESEIKIANTKTAGLTAVICDNGTDNTVVIKDSEINVANIEGRFYLGGKNGTITVENSAVTLNGVKEGFYLRAGQKLAINGTSNVSIALNTTEGRYGINVTDATATYTKAETATVTTTLNALAKIDNAYYGNLQAAVNAVQNGQTITLVNDITENVTLTEKVGLSYTIDGNGNKLNGTITISSLSDTNNNRRITIKGINFVTETGRDFITSTATNHYPRITVEGCSFTGTGKAAADTVAIRLKSSHSVIIKDCTGTGLHSFLQNTAGWNLTIENVKVTDSKGGLALGTVQGVTVKGCNIDVDGYGVRMDAQYNNNAVIESNTVNAFIPVVVRKASVDSKITVEGTNTMTATNTDELWLAIGTSEYETNGSLPTAATGKVAVNLKDTGLSYGGVYGNYAVASVNGVQYVSLSGAIAAANAGDTITFLTHITEDVTVSKDLTIDGNDKTYTGKMTLTSNKGAVTIKNVNFNGNGYNGYAVEARGVYYITIEDCTAKDYGFGFLQLASSTVKTTVKNVTVSNMNYGVKVDYSSAVVLENVDITANTAGILNSNYGDKTVTVKNSYINIIGTWTRNNTNKTTYVFDGANTVDEFKTEAALDNFKLTAGSTLAAPAGLTVTTDEDNCSVVYKNGAYICKGNVASVNGADYAFLADAIAAANAGDTITFLTHITEDVTVNKDLIIDGAGKNYTGKMTLTSNKGSVTIKNVNFDGKGYNGYAVEARGVYYITIEGCTAKNYGYGFLQLASSTVLTTVKNVTVSNMNYGVKVDYGTDVVLENVDITAVVAAVLNSNYGEKTITIKNSKLNIYGTWTRNNTTKTNVVFEGYNTVGQFTIDATIDTLKLAVDATLTAPEGETVTTDARYVVVYNSGVYSVVKAAAAIGNTYYVTIADAIKAANAGETVTVLAGEYTGGLTVNKAITVVGETDAEGNNLVNFSGKLSITADGATAKNLNFTNSGTACYVGAKNVLIEGCTLVGSNGLYQSYTSGKVTFKDSTITGGTYGIHFDGNAGGEIVIDNCVVTGWTSFAKAIKKVTMTGTTFAEGGYNFVRLYQEEVVIVGCTFNEKMSVDLAVNGATATVTNCTVENGTVEALFYGADMVNCTITVDGAKLVRVAKIGDVYYKTIDEALTAAKAGETVTILAGNYTQNLDVNKAITVVGEGEVNFSGKLSITADGATAKNLNFTTTSGNTGYINAKNVLIEDCTIVGADCFRYCYTSGKVTFKDSTITSTNTYAIHFDGNAGGEIVIDNCTVTGWNGLAGTLSKITFKDSIFNKGNYAGMKVYNQNLEITGCAFNAGYRVYLMSSNADVKVSDTTLAGKNSAMYLFTTDEINKNNIVVDEESVSVVAAIGNTYYKSLADALAAVTDWTTIKLVANATLDYNAREAYGKATTTDIIIDGQGFTLTLNQKDSDWSSIGMAKADGKLTLKNMTIEKTGYGDTTGTWNTHAIIFSCDVELNNVTVNNSVAVSKNATLKKVTINEANGYYGLWVEANGQTVTMNGGSITATNGGRGIKIADQYINAPVSVTLNVTDTKFTTAKKAAVLVSSKAGANITATNVDITEVAADSDNFVWVDGDWANYYDKVTVTGGTKSQEDGDVQIGNVKYPTLAAAIAAAKAGDTITLLADIEASEVIMINKSLIINGNGNKVTSTATRVFRVTTSNVEVTLNGVNMVSKAVRVGTNDIRGISIDASLTNVKLTLNNSSVDFTDASACDWAYAVNVSGNGTGHAVTVNGGTYEGANVINAHGANNAIVVKDATLTSLYPNADMYYGACIWVLQNQGSSVEATGNTFNGANAVAFNVGTGTAVTESNNTDNTTLCVAKIGTTYYTSLDAAFAAANAGDEVKILKAGTYALSTSGKDITITGAVDGVVFDNIGAKNMGGANVTFNNVTFNYASNSTYKGLQHAGNLVYNNCTFNGQVFLYGASETFNNCNFNTTDAANYNVWTYGAKQVAFNECTFNSAGKSVLIYAESASVTNDVTVTGCTFVASAPVEGKAAIEMDSSLTGGINLTITKTTATGFGTGNVSGNSLWNNKKGSNTDANNDIIVVVDGETVLGVKTFVAYIGNIGYTTIADAIKAAKAGDVVTVKAGNYTTNVDVNKAITVVGETDAEGNNLVNINGTLSITADGATVKNMTFDMELGTVGYINAKDVLVEGCKISGSQGFHQSYTTGLVTFRDCEITGDTYALNFDGSAGGEIVVEDSVISGWTSFAASIKNVTLKNTIFAEGTQYNFIRFYQEKVVIDGCTFNEKMSIDVDNNYNKNAVITVTNSTFAGGDMADLFAGFDIAKGMTVTIDGEKVVRIARAKDASGNVIAYYKTIQEAINAAPVGGSVEVFTGNYTENVTINKDITVLGEKKNGVNITGKLSIKADGATVKNLNFTNSGTACYVGAKNVTIDGCTLVGSNGLYQSYTSGLVTIKNSTITGGTYGIHFDGNAGGEIVIDNCVVTGWTSFAKAIKKVTMTDTSFEKGNYNFVRFYQENVVIDGCTFNEQMTVDLSVDGATVTVTDTTLTNGNVEDLFYGSDIVNSTITVDGVKLVRVAKIGDTYYKTIADAIAAAEAGNTVTILAGDYTGGLTINKAITVEGVGEVNFSGKLSITADGATAKNLNFTNSGTACYVGAKDVTIDGCTLVGSNGLYQSYTSGLVTFKNSTITGGTYGIHFDGNAGGEIEIDNCVITGWTSFAKAIKKVTMTDTTFAEGGYNFVRLYQEEVVIDGCTFNEKMTVDLSVDGATVTVTDTTLTNGNVEDLFYGADIVNSTITIQGEKMVRVAKIGDTYYKTIADAIEAANAGEIVALTGDVVLTEGLVIPAAATTYSLRTASGITLDLAGKTITGTDNATGSFALITNKGQLTIKDSVGGGKITLTATNNRGWNAYSSVISNTVGGKLVVESGTLEHLGGTDMAYGIDNLTNGKGTYAETVINGGTIKSTYRAIRQFLNGIEAQNILTVNGGTIEGANKSIWMQDPSTKANTGKLTVSESAVLNGDVYLFVTAGSTEWPVEVSIAAAALKGESTVVTGNVPEAYIVENAEGSWIVREANYVAQVGDTKYESLADAIAAANAGDTITFVADITEDVSVSKDLTIDGAGKNYTGKMTLTSNKGSVTIKNVNFDGKGYNGYAVEARGVYYITIEGCTAKNYGYGFLQLASSTVLTTVKNVTVSNMNYGVKVDYSSAVVLENVDITANVAAVLNSNYGEKTITIKNSKLNIYGTWSRNNTIKTNVVFEGDNTVGQFTIDATIDTLKLAVDATLTAPEGETVTTDARYVVVYNSGVYSVVKAAAAIGNTYYVTIADAIEAANAGETVTVLAGDYTTNVSVGKAITVVGETDAEGNNLVNITGNVSVRTGATVKNLNVHNTKTGEHDCALDVNGKDIVIEGVKLTGYNGMRYCYATGDITIKNSTINASNFAVHFDGKAGGKVAFENCDITGWCSYASTIESVSYTGCTLNQGSSAGHRYYNKNVSFTECDFAEGFKIDLRASGTNAAFVDSNMTVADVKALFKDPYYVAKGNVTLNDSKVTYVASGYVNGVSKYFDSLQDAINEVSNGNYITLRSDIVLTESINVPAGKKVTIGLNGFDITGTDNATGSFALINNQGELTIDGNGTITLTANNNRGWNAYSTVVSNQCGKLTINKGVTIQHLGGTDMAYGIDNLTNGNGTEATLTIKGGVIDSTYFAIRQFANNGTNNLSVEGGDISYIWMQSPNNNANVVNTIVKGGTIDGICLTGKNAVMTFQVAANTTGEVYGTAPVGTVVVGTPETGFNLVEAVAKIGDTYYATLQAAINAVQNGQTITLLKNSAENVTVVQAPNVAFTIDGNGKTMSGTITVDGKSAAYASAGLTIKNVEFDATNISKDASINLGGNNSTRYTSNVTVEGCTFTGTDNVKVGIKNYTGGCKNLTITGCTATGVHSLAQLKGVAGLTVKNVTVDGKNGIAVGTSTNVVIENATITATGYGIRADGTAAYDMTVTGAKIEADMPIVVRNTTGAYDLTVEDSELTGTNANGYGVIFTAEDDGTYIVPTGKFEVAVSDTTTKVFPVTDYVAMIGEQGYLTLAEAMTAAKDGDTITLIWAEGDAPIAMNGAVYGKSVTITGTATVDWSKGFMFVGRGGEGNGTVIFENANLTSASNSASYGIHVSGREKNTSNKYDGTLKIINSTIELDYLINKGTMTLDNTTLTVKNGFSIGGRPASETESGEDATATLNLTNGSKVVVNNHNGMGLGYEAIGVMNIDATSTFETTQSFLVTAKGTMNIAGTAKVAGTLTNKGAIVLTAANATLISSECGNVTTNVADSCVYYADGEYSVAGHTVVIDKAEAATCTETGLTEGKYCSNCDEILVEQTVIPALGHDEIAHEAKAPTCTEIGWDAYVTCSRCDYSTYVEIAANGHTAGAAVKENVVPETYMNDGSYDEVVYCSVCGAELSRNTITVPAYERVQITEVVVNDNLIYNGNAQAPSNLTVKAGDETLTADDYTVIVTKQTNAGTYTLTVTAKDGKYVGSITTEWKIAPAQINSVEKTPNRLVYNGQDQSITLTVKGLNGEIVDASNYTITGDLTGKNAKAYTLVVTGKGNYTGEIEYTWNIERRLVTLETKPATVESGVPNVVVEVRSESGMTGAAICEELNVQASWIGITEPLKAGVYNSQLTYNTENNNYNVTVLGVGELGNGKLTVTVGDYVAKNLTTNVSYTSVAAAMMAARAGETVQMIADSVEETSVVVMMTGATLDLNGFDLTAAGLAAFNGNYVIDSSAATTGLLIVPQSNLTLPKNNTELPFWNESNGYYFVSPNTSGYQRFTEQTADGFRFAFRPAFGMIDGQSAGDTREKYIAANGLNDNAISLVLKLRWVGSQGQTVTQEFVYTDELIKTAYNSGSLNITMSNLPVDEIDVQVVLVSETGVEFCGEIATYRAP